MAQGVQKKTEYAGLQFLGVSAVKKLLGFEIREAPGEHARGKFRVLLSEEAPVVCERNVRAAAGGGKPGRSPVLRIPAEDRDHDRARLADCGNRGSVRDSASGYGKAKPRIPGQEANLPRNCGCGHGGNGAQRLHSRRGRPGGRAEHSSSTGRQTGNSSREWRPGWDCPWCRTRGIITRGFTWGCRRGRKRSSGRFSPAGSALTGVIMRSAGDVPLIERISSAMMWSRGQGCR